MELLPKGTDNKTQVTFEDQQKINEFSTLMTHYDRLNDQLKSLESDKEQIDDVTLELELVDEDELIDYLIGGETSNLNSENNNFIGDGCFVKLKQKQVMKKLEIQSIEIDEKINKINLKLDNLNKTLSTLKTSLYAKFGNSINLER